jgi:thiamine-monophosphate kinase
VFLIAPLLISRKPGNSEPAPGYVIILAVKVSRLGEFGLIDLLAKMITAAKVDRLAPGRPLIGIGDDAAAWQADASIELATVDTMVQGVHFSPETTPWRDLGWKSLAINLSDIAAMGGVPQYALVALALPEDTAVADVKALYEGLIELAGQSGTAITGGNISRAPQVSVTVTVIGKSPDKKLLRRDTASPGETIAVTGHTGSAAAGLAMLTRKLALKPETSEYLKKAFLRPAPRLAEGRILVQNGIKTAIDTSDGLLADLRHICEASRVSARLDIDCLPVHPAVKSSFGKKARELALSGGEDYELLFTGSAAAFNRIKKELNCPVTAIGQVTAGAPGKIDLFDAHGRAVKASRAGWRHF